MTFVAGVFTSEDLNDSAVQNFYMAQEAIDKAALALGVDTDDNWAGQAKRLKDIAEPTAGTDAVTKDYADALATGTLGSPISIANGGTASATASAARTALGLAIDTDVPSQASFDALNVLTTRGDLLVRGATVPERIAVGTATHVLTSDGTDSAWAVLPTAGDALAGILETATAAEQETGTAVDKIVTPGRQHSHVSAAKAWIVGAYSGGTPTDSASYNIASMDDDGTGLIGMHFTNAFSSANFPVAVTSESSAGVNNDSGVNTSVARSTTTVDIQIRVGSAANDAPFNMICVGDQ